MPWPMIRLDPMTLAIRWQRLIRIRDEINNATVRTSFSMSVGASRDFACTLGDQDGYAICQSSFSPPECCVMLP